FAENRPSYTVQTRVDLPGSQPTGITGAIGVGTWETSAEFKDIRVEKSGQVLFASDFSNGAATNWKTDGGDWSVVNGAYRQNSLGRHVPGSVETNRWYDIKVDLSDGRRVRCYLDGKLIHDEPVTTPNRFFALGGIDESSGDLVIKAINAASEPLRAAITLNALNQLG